MQMTKHLRKLELCERVAELLDWADGVEIEPGRLWWLASSDVLQMALGDWPSYERLVELLTGLQ